MGYTPDDQMYDSKNKRLLSKITLYSGAPFDDTYKHVVNFKNNDQIDDYLNNFYSVSFKGSYQKLDKAIRFPTGITMLDSNNQKIKVDYNDIINYNYIRIENYLNMNVEDKGNNDWRRRIYYAFPTNFSYTNDGMTLVHFSLDLWNSYSPDVSFTNGYVKRATLDPFNYATNSQQTFQSIGNKNLKEPVGWSSLFKGIRNNQDEIGGDGATVNIQNGNYNFVQDFTNDFVGKLNGDFRVEGGGTNLPEVADTYDSDFVKQYNDTDIMFVVYVLQPKDATKDVGTRAGIYTQYRIAIAPFNPATNMMINLWGIVSVDDHDEFKKMLDFGDDGLSVQDWYKRLVTDSDLVGTDSLVVDSEVLGYFGLHYYVVKANDLKVTDIAIDADLTGAQLKVDDKDTLLYLGDINVDDFVGQIGVAEPATDNRYYLNEDKIIYKNRANTPFANFYKWFNRFLKGYQGDDGIYLNPKLVGGPFTNFQFSDGRGTTFNVDMLKNFAETDWYTDSRKNQTWLPRVVRFGGLVSNSKIIYSFPDFNNYGAVRTSLYSNTLKFMTPRDYENSSVIDGSAHDVPIILDTYTMFLNANRNQLAINLTNARIAKELAMEGNAVNLKNAYINADATAATAAVQGSAQASSAGVMGAATSQAGSIQQAGMVGGYAHGHVPTTVTANAKATAASASVMGGAQAAAGAISGAATAEAGAIQAGAQRQIAENNYAFQNKVAQNNYEQVVRSQQAQLADVKNQNDMVANQGSSIMFDFQNKNIAGWKLYTSNPSVMKASAMYFNLFGVEVDQFLDVEPLFNQFDNFNYLKVEDIQIDYLVNGKQQYTVPQVVIDNLKAIFANGVTVWNYSNDATFRQRFYTKDARYNVPTAGKL